ncbi:MBL fold metallo-hydrolase [Variovorax ginsengisoli]|uniref:Glyoxylase-like metal-dependent hydrolase (Beta-lactamase superfamily II) n=1 Tax=Variovorax ginsengisoli TaxID=363844 RepID=A0ABT9SDG7_9BURK|nr:MBL fold metallo-hydrolase [Variovorax ginsengisoli]MDP9901863.1 glyoxylase-like metal-dependent hydrolase (beta-lactamase superfamily II) [Variovorax ginsengisoli]
MSFLPIFRTVLGGALSVGLTATALAAQPLKLEVYNPGKNSVFPVSSEIVVGDKEALLIDAQFQRNDAQALVEKIKATGKKLTTVYISHSDPDYYFGLDVIRSAFPEARIVATQATVDAIQASKDGKLAHWGPILKDNAPQSLVVPEVLGERGLTVDGRKLDIVGPNPARTVVWIPSIKAVVGGVPVSANIHVWVADTQTPASRQSWLQTLDAIDALHPRTVVPGHYLPDADGKLPHTPASVKFTRSYLQAFEQEAAKSTDAAALIARMKQRYPQLGESSSLDLGAKVIKGEMKWPQ